MRRKTQKLIHLALTAIVVSTVVAGMLPRTGAALGVEINKTTRYGEWRRVDPSSFFSAFGVASTTQAITPTPTPTFSEWNIRYLNLPLISRSSSLINVIVNGEGTSGGGIYTSGRLTISHISDSANQPTPSPSNPATISDNDAPAPLSLPWLALVEMLQLARAQAQRLADALGIAPHLPSAPLAEAPIAALALLAIAVPAAARAPPGGDARRAGAQRTRRHRAQHRAGAQADDPSAPAVHRGWEIAPPA